MYIYIYVSVYRDSLIDATDATFRPWSYGSILYALHLRLVALLTRIFTDADEDGSGWLTVHEFVEAAGDRNGRGQKDSDYCLKRG